MPEKSYQFFEAPKHARKRFGAMRGRYLMFLVCCICPSPAFLPVLNILQILFGMGAFLYFISGTLPDEIGKFEARPVSIEQ